MKCSAAEEAQSARYSGYCVGIYGVQVRQCGGVVYTVAHPSKCLPAQLGIFQPKVEDLAIYCWLPRAYMDSKYLQACWGIPSYVAVSMSSYLDDLDNYMF